MGKSSRTERARRRRRVRGPGVDTRTRNIAAAFLVVAGSLAGELFEALTAGTA
jgi:hypothetical protein